MSSLTLADVSTKMPKRIKSKHLSAKARRVGGKKAPIYKKDGGEVNDAADYKAEVDTKNAVEGERDRSNWEKYGAKEHYKKVTGRDEPNFDRFDYSAGHPAPRISPLITILKKKGGAVKGPGGPRDDRVPAMLSNGEHVVKASTVKKIGGGSEKEGHRWLNGLNNTARRKSAPIYKHQTS